MQAGCASAGSCSHPVPPSALVPDRKYRQDPTPIRHGSRASDGAYSSVWERGMRIARPRGIDTPNLEKWSLNDK